MAHIIEVFLPIIGFKLSEILLIALAFTEIIMKSCSSKSLGLSVTSNLKLTLLSSLIKVNQFCSIAFLCSPLAIKETCAFVFFRLVAINPPIDPAPNIQILVISSLIQTF